MLPPIGTYCLGTAPPKRSPRPAATTSAHTLVMPPAYPTVEDSRQRFRNFGRATFQPVGMCRLPLLTRASAHTVQGCYPDSTFVDTAGAIAELRSRRAHIQNGIL